MMLACAEAKFVDSDELAPRECEEMSARRKMVM
jgi:hypothetical protein